MKYGPPAVGWLQLPPAGDQYTGSSERSQLMANPMSGILADVMAGTPPLSASDVDPTKASDFGMRSATSDAFVDAFCWSSSTSRASLRPQIPPAAFTAENNASTPWLP